MKVFKSDGRYNHHKKGLIYIGEFLWNGERKLFASLLPVFEKMYGPQRETVQNEKGFTFWQYNENYRFEQNARVKRRRIYVKDEGAFTIAMLQLEN